jgi:hypothetical protein
MTFYGQSRLKGQTLKNVSDEEKMFFLNIVTLTNSCFRETASQKILRSSFWSGGF